MPVISEQQKGLQTLENIIEWEILQQSANNDGFSSDHDQDSLSSDSDEALLPTLLEFYFVMDNTRYMDERHQFSKSKDFFDNYFESLPCKSFRQLTRMDRSSFFELLSMIENHHVFKNKSTLPQALVALQLAVTLDRLGHYGNGCCISHLVTNLGASHGSMVNFTHRCMTALRSALVDQVKWPDQTERLRISGEFAQRGFRGCIGLIDGTLFPLSQRPKKDGECYWDRKCRYSINAQVVCNDRRRIILFYTGNPRSCSNLTYLRRCPVWPQLQDGTFFDDGQYLLGDSGYVPLPHLVASYKQTVTSKEKQYFNFCVAKTRYVNEHCIGILKSRWHWTKEIWTQLKEKKDSKRMVKWLEVCVMLHNFVLNRNDDWSEKDKRIDIEREIQTGVSKEDLDALYKSRCKDMLKRGKTLQEIILDRALAFNREPGGVLWDVEKS